MVYFTALIITSLLIHTAVTDNGRVKRQDDSAGGYGCPAPDGMFADPDTCRRFYTCVEGHPFRSYCPPGLNFDDIRKTCDYAKNVVCGPVSSTPPTTTSADPNMAFPCDLEFCKLPTCFCSADGTRIPGNLPAEKIPQMILLTFDNAVNLNNFAKYRRLFREDRTNPNGCSIKGTYFVSHEYSNYQQVQALYSDGHEMALHTISLKQGMEDEGFVEWASEMIGMREILKRFSYVDPIDILGMRAPYLKPGRNIQFQVLSKYNLTWDSSISIPPLEKPIWPYTLDYHIPHECRVGTCPTQSFPGIWEFPLNSHHVESFEGGHCPYMDQCVLNYQDPEDVFSWLLEDFSRHYDQNRAPYVMSFHTNWFTQAAQERGLHYFIDWALEQGDIYFVTMTDALYWIVNPTPLNEIDRFEPWDCTQKPVIPKPCKNPPKCALPFSPDKGVSEIRYMTTCHKCPARYPWVGDVTGVGLPTQDYLQ